MASNVKVKKEMKADKDCVDNVDNTAPPQHLLEEIAQTNSKAYMFLKHTRRPRRHKKFHHNNLHCDLPGLPLTAFPDDWDGDLDVDFFERFPYKCLQPKMITPLVNADKQDPVSGLLKLKQEWSSKAMAMRHSALCAKESILEKMSELNEEVWSCPRHLVDLAQHLESDPDPYMDSPSNWYYAGNGNMQLIYCNNIEYMLRSEFHYCYLFEFNREELNFSQEPVAVFDCGEGNNIFESNCSSEHIIALRTKHKIFVLKIVTSDDSIQTELLKVSESEMPFTSISFDEYHKNILYVTNLINELKIVNIDRITARTVKLKNTVSTLVNNWNSVIGSERFCFTHVTKNSIRIYDKRTNSVVHKWGSPNDMSDEMMCNHISAAKYSPASPYLYFGTNHHLFLIDTRYKAHSKLRPLQRWTHGMQCIPTYIKLCNFEFNKELVCLSSQWCQDTCVVPNYIQSLKEMEFSGMTLPFRLPNILQTLNEARLQGLCHDVHRSLERRLVTALSGTVLLEQAEKYVLLSQNSLGDVSAHILYPEQFSEFIEDDSLQALHDWSQDYKVEKKDLEVSFVRDISNIWKSLQRIPEGVINEGLAQESRFNEQEIYNLFESGELDEGLLDVWVDGDETNVEDSTLGLSLNITGK